jgi:hypothetical protein
LSAGAQKAGHAILATLLALLVTGVTLAVLLMAQMIADDIAHGRGIHPGEVISALLYLLILGTALTVAFGVLPFATLMLALMRLRTRAIAAFALGGAMAGAIAAVAFVLVVHSGDTGKAIDEFRKLALEDFSGIAVLVASAFGAVMARPYLARRGEIAA